VGAQVTLAEGAGAGINDLARFFARDELPEARTAIANRILAELKGLKRLCPSSLEERVHHAAPARQPACPGAGKYLSNEALIGAFTDRSKRLVTHEPLQQFMSEAAGPDEKIEKLMIVEENIIGVENKRTLSTFILPIITLEQFRGSDLRRGATDGTTKAHGRAAEAHSALRLPGYAENPDRDGARFRRAAHRGARKILGFAGKQGANPVERAQTLVKLISGERVYPGRAHDEGAPPAHGHAGQSRAFCPPMSRRRLTAGTRTPKAQSPNSPANSEAVGIAPEDARRVLAA